MINETKAGKCNCNSIMFRSAESVKPGSNYFTVPTEVREISIKSMLKKIYESDFVGPESQYCVNNDFNLNYGKLLNDRRFLELIGK